MDKEEQNVKTQENQPKTKEKKWIAAFLFSLLLGFFGADRFYLGKPVTAVLKLITFGGLGIWVVIDFILIATRSMSGVVWAKDGENDKLIAWIVFGVVMLSGVSSAIFTPRPVIVNTTVKQPSSTTTTSSSSEDLSKVSKEYTLTAGHYTAGIDLPAGQADIAAVSGKGNLSSSNLYNGGVNEMFGIDDGSKLYTSSFKGLSYPKDTVLSLNGRLSVKLTYTKVESNYTGRNYVEADASTFSTGNFKAGEDVNFAAGTYKIVAVSGRGNLSSSNIYDGGVNEMFGIDDGSGMYLNQFMNAEFKDGTTMSVAGGLVVRLIPAK